MVYYIEKRQQDGIGGVVSRQIQQVKGFKGVAPSVNPNVLTEGYIVDTPSVSSRNVDVSSTLNAVKPYADHYDMTTDNSAYHQSFLMVDTLKSPDGKLDIIGNVESAGSTYPDFRIIEDFGGSPFNTPLHNGTMQSTAVVKIGSGLFFANGRDDNPAFVSYTEINKNMGVLIDEGTGYEGTTNFEVNWDDSTFVSPPTVYLKIVSLGSSSSETITSVVDDTVNGGVQLTFSSASSFSVGDTISVDIIWNDDEAGNWEDVNTYTVTAVGTGYVTIYPAYTASQFVSGSVNINDKSWGFQYSTDGGSTWSSTTTIDFGNWQDLGYGGLKLKFADETTLQDGALYYLNVYYNSLSTSYSANMREVDNSISSGDFSNIKIGFIEYDTNGEFTQDYYYYVGISYTLDGNNETPIIILGSRRPQTTYKYLRVEVDVSNMALSGYEHYSAINLWVAKAPSTNKHDRGAFRLIKNFNLNQGQYIMSGTNVTIRAKTDTTASESYESMAGIPDTYTEYKIPKCTAAALLNDTLFIGNANMQGIPQERFMIYRSLPGQYQTFRYTEDYLILPDEPQVLASFEGKLYAFCANKIYRINYNLYIEDVFEELGAIKQQEVFVGENGIYWMTQSKRLLFYDGRQIKEVLNLDGFTFSNSVLGYRQKSLELLLFLNSVDPFGYSINMVNGSIGKFYINDAVYDVKSVFNDTGGELYISQHSTLKKVFGAPTYPGTQVIIYTFGDALELEKKFYYLNLDITDSSAISNVYYSADLVNWYSLGSSDNNYAIKDTSGSWVRAKELYFRIHLNNDTELRGYTIVYRTLRNFLGVRI